jgi:uncharacterized protein (TIGR00251 family)
VKAPVGVSTRIRIRVSPGAARAEIVGRHGDGWKVRVVAAPEDGRANEAVVRLLSGTLGSSRGDVEIVAGHSSRDKVVTLAGIGRDEIDACLDSATVSRGTAKRVETTSGRVA